MSYAYAHGLFGIDTLVDVHLLPAIIFGQRAPLGSIAATPETARNENQEPPKSRVKRALLPRWYRLLYGHVIFGILFGEDELAWFP